MREMARTREGTLSHFVSFPIYLLSRYDYVLSVFTETKNEKKNESRVEWDVNGINLNRENIIPVRRAATI